MLLVAESDSSNSLGPRASSPALSEAKTVAQKILLDRETAMPLVPVFISFGVMNDGFASLSAGETPAVPVNCRRGQSTLNATPT
ncbi:MAG TPA: hypothetical protein VJU84_10555 [Pyrinomonadaceae bacterium]|nr:hypothetical protein [Pyrinomonadaceae bacterium]